MIDGIKVLDLSLDVENLLSRSGLLFPLPVDEQTGEVLHRPRLAYDRGLTFRLVPSLDGQRLRCELQGSLHRYSNQGIHNANDFSLTDLRSTLSRLTTNYGVDLAQSRINNLEFGLNLSLPFPVGRVLSNLISYKNRPFNRYIEGGFTYHQCETQRYVLKLYDKGEQYRTERLGLPANLLRIEVKVTKMAYLTQQGVNLYTLADLLDEHHYAKLGAVLAKVFGEILFDEPSVDAGRLRGRQRDLFQNGRNPKFWDERRGQLALLEPSTADPDQRRAYHAQRERLRHDEARFRQLLARYRSNKDWLAQVADLLRHQWTQLSVSPDKTAGKLTGLVSETSGKLTDSGAVEPSRGTPACGAETSGKLTDLESGKFWQINRLNVGLKCHIAPPEPSAAFAERGTPVEQPVETCAIAEQSTHRIDESEGWRSSDSASWVALSSASPTPSPTLLPAPPMTNPSTPTDLSPAGADPLGSAYPGPTLTHPAVQTPARRLCPITGLDITHQRADCRLLSMATIRHYATAEPARFADLKARYLPAWPLYPTLKGECRAIDAAIRQLDKRQRAHSPPPSLPSPPEPPPVEAPPHRCSVTGLELAGQRPESRTLTSVGLRALVEREPERFAGLRTRFLPPDHESLTLDTSFQINAIATEIRCQADRQAYRQRPRPVADERAPRYCLLTGLLISRQPPNSWLLSAKTIRQLAQTQAGAYRRLEAQYLPDEALDEELVVKSEAIAYQIRRQAYRIDRVAEVGAAGMVSGPQPIKEARSRTIFARTGLAKAISR